MQRFAHFLDLLAYYLAKHSIKLNSTVKVIVKYIKTADNSSWSSADKTRQHGGIFEHRNTFPSYGILITNVLTSTALIFQLLKTMFLHILTSWIRKNTIFHFRIFFSGNLKLSIISEFKMNWQWPAFHRQKKLMTSRTMLARILSPILICLIPSSDQFLEKMLKSKKNLLAFYIFWTFHQFQWTPVDPLRSRTRWWTKPNILASQPTSSVRCLLTMWWRC